MRRNMRNVFVPLILVLCFGGCDKAVTKKGFTLIGNCVAATKASRDAFKSPPGAIVARDEKDAKSITAWVEHSNSFFTDRASAYEDFQWALAQRKKLNANSLEKLSADTRAIAIMAKEFVYYSKRAKAAGTAETDYANWVGSTMDKILADNKAVAELTAEVLAAEKEEKKP